MGYIGISALLPGGGKRKGFIGPFGSLDEQKNFMDYIDGRYSGSSTTVVSVPYESVPEGFEPINPIDFDGLQDLPVA